MVAEPVKGMSAACPPAFLPSLHDPDVKPAAAGSTDLPRAVLKHLKPLGHEIKLWSLASAQLVGRLHKDRLTPELSAFLRTWMPGSVPEMPAGPFTLLLGESSHGWQIATSSLAWLNDPTWAALLRLPALKNAWMSDLRASHFEHLLHLLPQAWVMDRTPLPPGSVIPGLEIPSWPDLVRLRDNGRVFKIDSTILSDQQPENHWRTTITDALKTAHSLCVEPIVSTTWLLARYHQHDDELSLSEAWSSTRDAVQASVVFRASR